jgi:hypothetical protein
MRALVIRCARSGRARIRKTKDQCIVKKFGFDARGSGQLFVDLGGTWPIGSWARGPLASLPATLAMASVYLRIVARAELRLLDDWRALRRSHDVTGSPRTELQKREPDLSAVPPTSDGFSHCDQRQLHTALGLSASLCCIFEDWRRFTLTVRYAKRATLACLPRLRVLDCETPR